jgi:hypothetical protein
MQEKIVFNGTEYDGVDAMPPDVRKQYEHVMTLLGGERAQLGNLLDKELAQRKIVNVTTRVVVNGKEYHGPTPGLSDPLAQYVTSGNAPSDTGERGGYGKILLGAVIGALVAWWFLKK